MDATELATKQIYYSAGLLRTLADQERLIAEQAATLATLVAALREIEAHHVELNNKAGRALIRSKTLRIARRALAASACGSTATESR